MRIRRKIDAEPQHDFTDGGSGMTLRRTMIADPERRGMRRVTYAGVALGMGFLLSIVASQTAAFAAQDLPTHLPTIERQVDLPATPVTIDVDHVVTTPEGTISVLVSDRPTGGGCITIDVGTGQGFERMY